MRSFLFLLCLFTWVSAEPVTVRVMLIGWPLYDAVHPITKQPIESAYSLFKKFEAQNPDIRIELIPAQWGSSDAGYQSKTRALLLSKAVDVLEVVFATELANQKMIDDLGEWIDTEIDSSKFLPGALDRYAAFYWKSGKRHRFGLPLYCLVRSTSYDRQIFADFGIDTLSTVTTPTEVLERAEKLTGVNPRTGKSTYGLAFRGQHKLFLITNLMASFGGGWGYTASCGALRFTWQKQENLEAVLWLLKATKYCPPSFMGSGEEQTALWNTTDNNAAIFLHAFGDNIFNQNYMPDIKMADGTQRFRYLQLFRDAEGKGGFSFGSSIALASSSQHKPEALRFIKWMSESVAAQQYMVSNMQRYPVIRDAYDMKVFKENENFKNAIAELNIPSTDFPYGGTPIRFAMEHEMDIAFKKARDCNWDTLMLKSIAKEYLDNLQSVSDKWTATQEKYPLSAFKPFKVSNFATPFLVILTLVTSVFLALNRRAIKSNGSWYLFLMPSLLIMAVFLAYPIAESFRLSLFKSNGFWESFAGIDNYRTVITDPNFRNALYNTVYIGLFNLCLGIPIGFVLASMINSQRKAQAAFKLLYFMPMVTSVIASAVLFKYLFVPDIGLVNYFLASLGFPVENLLWLTSPDTSKFVVILFALWHGTGYTVLICLSGLQSIPDYMYEAASIDGCSSLQKWRHITLPNMRPTFVFLFMTGCIGALNRFGDVYIFGGAIGAPARSIQTVVAYIFEQAFGAFNFGAASAAAYLLFALILFITLLNYRSLLQKEI
ncbi:MAG: extracellular solute-binding protein [Fibrobacteres bacterium]|nr:extracellular solute-binding protein [Fibrobacterota bacterium]